MHGWFTEFTDLQNWSTDCAWAKEAITIVAYRRKNVNRHSRLPLDSDVCEMDSVTCSPSHRQFRRSKQLVVALFCRQAADLDVLLSVLVVVGKEVSLEEWDKEKRQLFCSSLLTPFDWRCKVGSGGVGKDAAQGTATFIFTWQLWYMCEASSLSSHHKTRQAHI